MDESLKLLKDAIDKAEKLTKAMDKLGVYSVPSGYPRAYLGDCHDQAYLIKFRLEHLINLINEKSA